MNQDYALLTVITVALACMMSVLILGEIMKPFLPHKPIKVPCSITIVDMARKLNVTLLDSCEIVN